MQNTPPDGWIDAFYCTSYADRDAIVSPRLAPRGKQVHGPFSTYGAAMEHAMEMERNRDITHFEVSKQYVRDDLGVPFLDIING